MPSVQENINLLILSESPDKMLAYEQAKLFSDDEIGSRKVVKTSGSTAYIKQK